MIWCRFENAGKTSFGIIEDGNVTEVWGDPLTDYAVTNHVYALADVKLLAPIKPPMLYAAGPNYRGHVEGMAARRGSPPSYPDRPSPNYRSVHAIIGSEENIVVPAESSGAVQPEGQLAVVMGRKARNVPVSEALDYVFGYTIVYRVKYGGRHPESFCVTAGQWQRYRIKYWGYDGNNWFVPHEAGRGPWRSTGTPGLDFHTYFRNVDLDIGGWVYAKLRYKGRNWCLNTDVV